MAEKIYDLYGEFNIKDNSKNQLQQASSAAKGFRLQIDQLEGLIARFVGAQQLTRFLQSCVGEAMNAEIVFARFNNVLSNLGFGKQAEQTQIFLNNLMNISTFSDEQLAASFQNLITRTKNYTESQSLLRLAMEISAGTGKDLIEVSTMLADAYQGNRRGLAGLGREMGLTIDESKDFNEIVGLLRKSFKDANEKELSTTAGQIKRLRRDFNELKEEIGTQLLPVVRWLTEALNNFLKGWKELWGGGQKQDIKDMDMAMEANQKILERWREACKDGHVTLEQYKKRIQALTQSFVDLNPEIKTTGNEITKFHSKLPGEKEILPGLKPLISDFQKIIPITKETTLQFHRFNLIIGENTEKTTEFTDSWLGAKLALWTIGGQSNLSKEAIKKLSDAAYQAGKSLQDAFVDIGKTAINDFANNLVAVCNGIQVSWQNLINNLLQMLEQLIAKLLVTAAVAGLLSVLTGGGSAGFMSFFGLLFETPRGDLFARREGRDFFKNFFSGGKDVMGNFASAFTPQQQPQMILVKVETNLPATVKAFGRQPIAIKSEFVRNTIQQGLTIRDNL
jgi:hypothetical protein